MAESVLITASELAGRLAGKTPPAVLDVRWTLGGPSGHADYLEGHIPSAVFVDLDTALASPPGEGGRHPLPETADFEAAMRAAGVSSGRPVVVYDASDIAMSAARAWWCLRYFGHEKVRVLDGGYPAWVAGAYRVDTGAAVAERGDFQARPGNMPTLNPAAALTLIERGGILIDARAPERFRGDQEPIDAVAGHIPGARNLPAANLMRTPGQFAEPGNLAEKFASVGASGHLVVGAYCGSGITAAQTVLAAAVVGFDVALYPGSWSHWITDPSRPVALGDS